MIWLKITMAAVMSGTLFAMIDYVLPPRPPQPFAVEISGWPGDQLFALIGPLGLAPSERLVRLEIRRAPPGKDAVEDFRAGRVDAALIGLERLPELLSDEVRLIYAYDEVAGGGALVAAPGVMRAADLGNRPVGVSFGGASEPLLRTLLGRAGLDPGSVSLTPLAAEAAEAALAGGRIGAAAVLSPSRAKGLRDRLGTALLASTEDIAGLSTHVLVVREGRIADRRDQIVAVLRALSGTTRACRAAMEHCLELLASASGRAAAEWRRDFEAVRPLDAADNRALLEGGGQAPLARRLAALTGAAKTASPPAMEWLDPSLAADAARP